MYNLVYRHDFLKAVQRLPENIQVKLDFLLSVLESQPRDGRLHVKSLNGDFSGCYSFRITREWRVIFQFIDTQTIYLFMVGHRKDIYK